jgi:pilus assembly protein CpaB
MDRRFLTVLGISLIFALVVSTMFYKMAVAGSGKKQSREDVKEVVIAAKPLNVGVTIKAEDLKLVKVPADQFPKGGFSKMEDVVGRPVISNILAEEAVLAGRLAERGSGLGLAPVIPVGMRAVTVRVSDVVGVAGFVLPGLRVDVLVTGRPPNGSDTITRTVLQNILVLSSGTTLQPDARGQPINAPTVTLLVTPEQAEILTLAGNEGKIQLVLRNGADQTVQPTPGKQLAALYGAQARPETSEPRMPSRPRASPALAAASAPPAPPPPPEVVIIRGDKRTVERVAPPARN